MRWIIYILLKCIRQMIHAKNKGGFKKTTSKIESTEIRKNILDMIKGTLNTPQNGKQPTVNNENVSNNTTKINPTKKDKTKEFTVFPHKKQQINTFEFSQLAPKICQSIHGTPKTLSKAHLHYRPELISNVFTIQINSGDPNHKGYDEAQEQYLNLLEAKLRKIQQEKAQYLKECSTIKQIHETYLKQHQQASIFHEHFLTSFYHDARNILIDAATQLIQCRDFVINHKDILSSEKSEKNNNSLMQIDEINNVLGKCQQILTVYHKMDEEKTKILEKQQIGDDVELRKLEKKCKYQEKTIDLLRKEHPYNLQFYEIKLLRHEINRLSDLNEKLLIRCKKLKQKDFADKFSPLKNKSPLSRDHDHKSPLSRGHDHKSPQKQNKKSPVKGTSSVQEDNSRLEKQLQSMKEENMRLGDLLQIIQLNNKKLEEEVKIASKRLGEEEDRCYKFKEEKEVLIEFLEEEKIKNLGLQKKIQSLQTEEKDRNQNQAVFEKMNLKLDKNKNIISAEQLCRQLKPYPQHFNLFRKILTDYEQKISSLQEQICEQKTTKDKFKEWSSSVYQLLIRHSSDSITQEEIETQLQELYKVDQYIENSRLQKLLRQIKSLSIGVDESEIVQMLEELGEYVVTLKQRNQVIKEVEYEDGSSVAYSDTFTDQEFDE